MAEVTISLDGHAEELAVFGSRDQFLRQIRDAVGVNLGIETWAGDTRIGASSVRSYNEPHIAMPARVTDGPECSRP